MKEPIVYYAKHEGLVVFKLVGAFSFSQRASKSLDAFIDKLFSNEEYENILIDLTETESLDSTNLGLLAKLTRLTMDLYDKKATIVSTNKDINEILESVGFEQVFNMVTVAPNSEEELEELPEGRSSERELSHVVLDAHRELLELNEKNQEMFRDVVEMLEEQMKDSE